MDAIKRIGLTLLNYYDKIILGVLLAGLAAVMVQESWRIQQVNQQTMTYRGDLRLPKDDVKPLDETTLAVNLEVDDRTLWQPIFRVQRDENFQIGGISIALRSYLRKYGETSLFDPAIYVYSTNDRRDLVHYDTKINPYSRLPEGPGASTLPTPKSVTETTSGSTETAPLVNYLRFYRVVQRVLPIELKRITPNDVNDKTTWSAQVNVESEGRIKSLFVNLGTEIEIGGTREKYKVVDMDYRMVNDANNVPREVSSITLRQDDGTPPIVLPRNRRVPMGSSSFRLVVLPPVSYLQKPYGINTTENQVFPISVGTGTSLRMEYYKVTGQLGPSQIQVRKCDQAGNPIGEQTTVNRLQNTELTPYRGGPTTPNDPEVPPAP